LGKAIYLICLPQNDAGQLAVSTRPKGGNVVFP
jgi:hypothetical protein